ncbi:uncharacterized protein CIMG_01976 [Coccidioides immitis RS]|uniref:Uncharacterized protein n=1 Tax=Coccidioides immitis (strain RS) TaxID=246410 RepID=J3KKD5_COCIM|nr:uncharacterized protein CIMG_01976 [Coccidioides immitis RS]EAS36622.3 hypothetical protein CIMG_01976 [Coccidioides immitis RS]
MHKSRQDHQSMREPYTSTTQAKTPDQTPPVTSLRPKPFRYRSLDEELCVRGLNTHPLFLKQPSKTISGPRRLFIFSLL